MPDIDIDDMWKRAGADKRLVVQCPHAVSTVSTATSLPVGVRTAADLTKLGLPVQCESIADAIQAEFAFFSEQRRITAQVFVENLGYTIARGILRSVFSERNPQLLYEFLQMGPNDEPDSVAVLINPFLSANNGVHGADMITETQVKAILKDYRRELSTKMTVGQQYALLHVQQKLQREEEEKRRQEKMKAERAKLVADRSITAPGPHTAAFKAKPKGAAGPPPKPTPAPLVAFGSTGTVVVPLGVPENTSASAPATVAAMSTTVSAAASAPLDVVLTGGVMSKGRAKKPAKGTVKKTARRPRARKKTAKTKVKPVKPVEPVESVEPTAPATPPRPKLMMLDDDNEIDSAAALAVAKTAPPRPGLMMLEGDDGDDIPPPPKLVRQTNGAAYDLIDAKAGPEAGTRQEEKKAKKRRSRATRKKKDGEKKSVKKRKTSKKS